MYSVYRSAISEENRDRRDVKSLTGQLGGILKSFFFFFKRMDNLWFKTEKKGHCFYQNVQTGGFEQGDLVSDGERCEAGQLLSELHRLYDALGGEFTELIPQVYVQGYTSF